LGTRMARYERIKAMGGIDGIPTPWTKLNELTFGWHPKELVLVAGRTGTGKCVAEGTLIPNPWNGVWCNVESTVMYKGDVLSLHNGKIVPRTPSFWVCTGKKACIKVTSRLGNSIVTTPEHPYLTSGGWKRADELGLGEKVVVSAKIPEPLSPTVKARDEDAGNIEKHDVELLAILLSEGSYTGNHVGFSTACEEFLGVAKEAAKKAGFDVVYRSKYDYDFVGPERKRGKPAFWWYMRAKFNGLRRRKALRKTIPWEVWSLPNDLVKRFIEVFFAGDGCIDSRGNITIGLASEFLVGELSRLLLRFGVLTKKRTKYSTLGDNVFVSWELSVLSSSKGKFRDTFMDIPGPKARKLEKIKDAVNPNVGGIPLTKVHVDALKRAAGFFREDTGKSLWLALGGLLGRKGKKYGAKDFICPHGKYVVSPKVFRALMTLVGGYTECSDMVWLGSEDIYFDEVVSIEDAGERKVYDLTIPDDHNFIANGFVAHNTWILLLLAEAAWMADYKVLFVTFEMAEDIIGRRLDAISAKVPYHQLRVGELGMDAEDRYRKKMDELKDKTGFTIMSGGWAATPLQLEGVIGQLKPDIVFIDGVYLMDDGMKTPEPWKKVQNVADQLMQMKQRMAIPVVISAQFNRNVNMKKLKGGLESVGGSDRLVQNSDVVIGLFANDELRGDKELIFRLLKMREDNLCMLRLSFDFDKMDFSEKAEPETVEEPDVDF